MSKRKGGEESEGTKKKPEEVGDLKHRAFSGLKSVRDAMEAEEKEKARLAEEKRKAQIARGERPSPARPAPTPAPVPKKKPVDEVWRPDTDKELFAVAMSGVKPLAKHASGPAPRVPPAGGARQKDAGSGANAKMRRAQAEGDEALEVRWQESGRCEGARRGRAFALEALGRFAVVQESLDLHGLEPAEARTRVEEFVRTRRARGHRVVRVVHGVGRHSPDGESLLRDAVVRALSEPPGSREVDAFQTAEPSLGGAGAILVALRGR